MKLSEVFASDYLKAADLQGRSFQLVIDRCIMEDVGTAQKPDSKLCIYLRGAQKKFICNRTNAESISIVLGDETDNWRGHTLELFTMRVQGPNGMTDGIRCRVIVPQGQTVTAPKVAAKELPHPGLNQPGVTDSYSDDPSDPIPF